MCLQFAEKFGSKKRGLLLRVSVPKKLEGFGKVSVNIPRPSGAKATKQTPSSKHVCIIPRSGYRVHKEYSFCTALIGLTACALLSEEGEISEKPNPPIFPSDLNLVSVCKSQEKEVIWAFLNEYDNSLNSKKNPEIDKLIQFAINYYIDFVLPKKQYIKINDENKKIFEDILETLNNINNSSSSEEIQTLIYEIGKKHNFSNLRDYFKLIYQVLLGQQQGPRLGSFIKLYGIKKTCNLLEKVLSE